MSMTTEQQREKRKINKCGGDRQTDRMKERMKESNVQEELPAIYIPQMQGSNLDKKLWVFDSF